MATASFNVGDTILLACVVEDQHDQNNCLLRAHDGTYFAIPLATVQAGAVATVGLTLPQTVLKVVTIPPAKGTNAPGKQVKIPS